MNDVADVLERAADLLWVRGRTVGVGETEDGELCAVGALSAVTGDDASLGWMSATAASVALGQYVLAHPELIENDWRRGLLTKPEIAQSPHTVAYLWNDGTKDDELVIDTMRRCAKAVRDAA